MGLAGESNRVSRALVHQSNYDRIRKEASLWRAWASVKSSGFRSESADTQRHVREFAAEERRHLRRIQRQLQQGKFSFGAARGILITRPGKSPRPIVMASLDARIVQRAILDELQDLAALRPYFLNDNSFGGVQRKGRGDAIRAALEAMRSGARYFVRSDIKEFFTRIPRERALAVILKMVDEPTQQLLRAAVCVELENAADLAEFRDAFPGEERGVAQGFCLSSLLGNVLLADFDRRMNDRGVRCLRYVDDFLILADTEWRAMKAFDSATRLLDDLGLDAYDPRVDSEKADRGTTRSAFEFLGCSVQPGLVGPSAKSRERLFEKVDQRIRIGLGHIDERGRQGDRRASVFRVVADIGHIVHGWRESFEFCEQACVFVDIDRQLDRRLQTFLSRFWSVYAPADAAVRRALIGVPRLSGAVVSSSRGSACG